VEELNKHQQARARDYHNVFIANVVGAGVLKDLEDAFDGSPLDTNPTIMASKVGAADVIRYIRERINENVSNET